MSEYSFFKQIYKHSLITDRILQNIKEKHSLRFFKKDDYIIQLNRLSHHYYLLKSGLVRAQVFDYKGKDTTTQFFVPGDIVIAPLALFKKTVPIENCIALTDCEVWAISFQGFQELFETNSEIAEWGRLWMAEQITKLKLRSIEMIAEDATTRYLKLLKNKPEVIQQAPLKHIASYLGITDTSLSRIRKEIIQNN